MQTWQHADPMLSRLRPASCINGILLLSAAQFEPIPLVTIQSEHWPPPIPLTTLQTQVVSYDAVVGGSPQVVKRSLFLSRQGLQYTTSESSLSASIASYHGLPNHPPHFCVHQLCETILINPMHNSQLTTPKVAARTIHNLIYHPLSGHPGPFLARISSWPDLNHAIKGDRHIWLWQNFQIYGAYM
jgi:hypothetical protein